MLGSLKSKLTVSYLILVIIVLFMFGLVLKGFLEGYLIEQLENNLVKEAKLIKDLLKDNLINQPNVKTIDKLADKYGEEIGVRITVIDDNGNVLGDSSRDPSQLANNLQRPEVQEAIQTGFGKSTRYSGILEMRLKYVALPVKKEEEIIGIVRLALPLTQVNNILAGVFWKIVQAGLIVILIALLLGRNLTKRITEPIERMTQVAGRMAQGVLDERLRYTSDDELGRLSRVFNNMADELESKINEISEEKNKIEAVLTSMGDGVIAVDEAGRIILFNPAVENFFQIEKKEILGKYALEVTRNHKLDKVIMDSLKRGVDTSEEIKIIYPEERVLRVHVTPIIGEKAEIKGAVAVLRDVTELRRLEQMRTEFVGNVSHELRTPLTSIKGYVETLLDNEEPDSSVYQRFLQIIKDEADRLEQLITDLLDLSKMESQPRQLEQETVDLNEIIGDMKKIIAPKANDKDIFLQINLPDGISKVKGDRNQLRRLYINLVDNSIKYTPEGGEVEIKIYEEEEKVWTEIIDTGIGIPAEDLPRIFERFYRVDKARSRQLGGTGLGLAIVKHIIEKHKGEIEVESEVGEGTKFTFYFLKAD